MSSVETPKRRIHVVGAVVVRDGMVMCAQRGETRALPGMWEFPGGKVEPDEDARAALIREVDEELACEIAVGAEIVTTTHEYEFGVVTLTTFYCDLVSGTPRLTEHKDVRWLLPDELAELDWAPADIPAVAQIRADLGSDGA